MNIPYGNYIGKDIEVVILNKYSLVYIFDKLKNTIESYLLHTDGFICKAACISDANTRIDKEGNGRITFFRDIEGNSFFNTDNVKILNSISLMSMHKESDSYIFTMFDARTFSGTLQEKYENGELLPSNMKANTENTGNCLKEWHQGLHEIRLQDTVVGVEFNTPKHMYIFYVADNYIYCRAARYSTCNKGVVFTQNFRQNFRDFEGQSFAFEDNLIALNDVVISEDKFNPNQCIFSNYDIYWSVSKIENDCIYLNGCGGETYRVLRPSQ